MYLTYSLLAKQKYTTKHTFSLALLDLAFLGRQVVNKFALSYSLLLN